MAVADTKHISDFESLYLVARGQVRLVISFLSDHGCRVWVDDSFKFKPHEAIPEPRLASLEELPATGNINLTPKSIIIVRNAKTRRVTDNKRHA